ncbi:MAG: hypothetical protein ACYC1E_03880 [Propionibacteriaceae bacterium]
MPTGDSRAPLHARGYGLEKYPEDPAASSGVVRFDLPRLGDVSGLDAVHLQCHIDTDTLSLYRLAERPERLSATFTLTAVTE